MSRKPGSTFSVLLVIIGTSTAATPVCDKLKGGSPVGLEYSCRIMDYEPTFAVVSIIGTAKTVKFGYNLIRADNGNCGGGISYSTGTATVTSTKPKNYLIQSTVGKKCERLLIYLCSIDNKDVDCVTNLQVTWMNAPLSTKLPGPCLKRNGECTDAKDNCCDGFYCLANPNGKSYCYECHTINQRCTIGKGQCCATSQCIMMGQYGVCMTGMCSKIGEDCNQPCCDGLTCRNYQGKMQCTPPVPTCFVTEDNTPCPNSGKSCCAGRCSGPITSVCECSQKEYRCTKDADCCPGLRCGLKYRCKSV